MNTSDIIKLIIVIIIGFTLLSVSVVGLICLKVKENKKYQLYEEAHPFNCDNAQALEIIKKKRVDIDKFIYCATLPIVNLKDNTIAEDKQLELYNNSVVNNHSFVKDCNRCLTQEEYDLLKEVLL